jgi:uncharacterized SAM-binding protein YcdF (DUF218 family)
MQCDSRTVALVLGAAVWPGGNPSPTLRRRALHGAGLVRAGRAIHIIGCGGVGRHPPAEARVIADLCRNMGVAAVSEEAASTTTLENLRFAKPILARLGATRVIVVTDWYHAPRARLLAWGLGLRAVASCPPLAGTTWRGQLRPALREIAALPVALIRATVLRISAKP